MTIEAVYIIFVITIYVRSIWGDCMHSKVMASLDMVDHIRWVVDITDPRCG